MTLVMWLLGATVAATGSAVYLEYGTVSALSSLGALIYQNGVIDTTSERRREELPRIRLQTSQVHGDVCLCYVWDIHREFFAFLGIIPSVSPAIRDGRLPTRSSLVNVGFPAPP